MKKHLTILIGFLPVVIFAQELGAETTSQTAQSGGSFFSEVVFCMNFIVNAEVSKQDSFDMQKEYLAITKELNTIKEAKDFEKLLKIHKSIENLKKKNDVKQELTQKQIRALKLNLRLVLLNTIANNSDSAFNAGDTIYVNVQPPSGVGSFYSGMPPEEIKDPKLRREYEEAIKKNEEKIANYNFQTWIRRSKPRLLKEIAIYVVQNYSTGEQDVDEVTKAINTFISDNKTASSPEFMGKLRFGQFSQLMI